MFKHLLPALMLTLTLNSALPAGAQVLDPLPQASGRVREAQSLPGFTSPEAPRAVIRLPARAASEDLWTEESWQVLFGIILSVPIGMMVGGIIGGAAGNGGGGVLSGMIIAPLAYLIGYKVVTGFEKPAGKDAQPGGSPSSGLATLEWDLLHF